MTILALALILQWNLCTLGAVQFLHGGDILLDGVEGEVGGVGAGQLLQAVVVFVAQPAAVQVAGAQHVGLT